MGCRRPRSGMNFATFLQDKRAEPLLASLAFVLVFLAGFGLFSFTGSIEIAAAVIAVGGLAATLAINLINQARHKSNSSGEPHETRMRSLESAVQMAELRIAANESTIQSIVKTDIAPLKAKMAELDRLTDFDMSDKSPSRRGPRSEASPSEPVHSQTFHFFN